MYNIVSKVECTNDEIEELKVKRGAVLFTRTSETAEDVGWSAVMLDDVENCVFNGFTIKATPKTDDLLPEYCAYCFSTYGFSKQDLIKLLQYVFDYADVTLNDVSFVFRGDYITKKSEKGGNISVILGGQEPAYFINRSNHDGEIVVVARSGVSAGFVSYWNQSIFVTDGFGYEARAGMITTKYLYYFLKNIEKELNAMKRGAGVPHISGEELGKTLIILPCIEEQERIVSILDRFNDLCNDISTSLPAEIESRQKQYEYYRDKLLAFKEED